MTAHPPDADPGRDARSGYRHPATTYEWSNAVHMRSGKDRLEGPRLPHRLHAIAWALADRAEVKNGVLICWPALTVIAADLGMDRTNVARHLKGIEEAGWIIRESGGPKRNTRYRLVIPNSVVAPAPLVADQPLVAEEHPVVADTPLGSGPSATTVVAPAPHEVSIEVPNEVSNEVRLLSYVSNAGAGARELPPPPRSITEERRDTYVGVFDGMGRGNPSKVEKPADPLAEYAHLFSDWSRTQLRRRCAVEVARDPDPDLNPDGSIDALVLSIAQLYTLAARKGRRKETKAGFRDFVREFNEAATDDGIPEVATIRSLLGFEAA